MVVVTLCIRCGKSRIVSKTWSEHVGLSDITYTQSVCPDPECQKQVEALLKDRHDTFIMRAAATLKRRREKMGKSAILRKDAAKL